MSGHLTLARQALEHAIEHLERMDDPRWSTFTIIWIDRLRMDLQGLERWAETMQRDIP